MQKPTVRIIKEVSVNSINPNPNPLRKELGDLIDLTASIHTSGIEVPPAIAKVGENTYQVIDGDRRIQVAKDLGFETVICVVYEGLTDAEIDQKSFILNVERNQLTDIEKALHIRKVKDKYGYSNEELEILGYGSKGQISKLLGLLDLPEEIQGHISSGALTTAHGVEIRRLKNSKQMLKVAKLAIENDWSSKKTGSTVDRLRKKANKVVSSDAAPVAPKCQIPGVYFKDATDMRELPDKSVSLIVSSPPYYVGMEFEKGITFEEHEKNTAAVMSECGRVLIPGGVMVLNVADILNFKGKREDAPGKIKPMLQHYTAALRKHGIYLQDQVIWAKDSNPFTKDVSVNYTDETVHTQYRIVNRHEPIYIFRKKGERAIPSEDIVLESRLTREEWKVYAPSVWRIPPAKCKEHPAVFPDELVERIIKMYSFVGETVLDPFLGSGTTIKVARELGRDGVGYERDLRYKAVIMKKLNSGKSDEKIGTRTQSVARQFSEMAENQAAPADAETDMVFSLSEDVMFGNVLKTVETGIA